jgi:hypothetical protein
MNRYAWLVLLAAIPFAGCSHEAKSDAPAPEKKATTHEESAVHLDAAAQERLGVAVAELAPRSLRPQVQAYGRVVADPAQAFELRAPIAGTVKVGGEWPAIGATLPDGASIGSIEPRLSAIERADLGARLAAAKGEEATATAALDVAKSELERAKTLNADGKNVSDRVLEEAQGRVKVETARLSAATESRRDIEAALDPKVFAAGAIPLVLARGGEVLEVLARPGESVEAGAPIARFGRFDPALVRVELPIGVSVGKSERATVVAAAHPERPLAAQRVALAANSDTQGQALLFRATAGDLNLRPGEAVTAWIESDVPAVEGFVVPRSAVVRNAGKAWVYVRTGDAAFAREELAVDRAVPEGWLTTADWAKGARVVVAGAQSVLSAEIASASGGGGEEE